MDVYTHSSFSPLSTYRTEHAAFSILGCLSPLRGGGLNFSGSLEFWGGLGLFCLELDQTFNFSLFLINKMLKKSHFCALCLF